MRVIAGRLGGRLLKTVEGEGYRPAMGRTREALFSMLAARGLDWPTARVLDLFAGSGSLAFEAVSRGAPHALLVESAPQAVRCLTANTTALGLEGVVRLLAEDVLRVLKRPPDAPYHLVFMDPPYRKRLADPALRLLTQRGWLAPGAFVTAEVEKEARLSPPLELRLEVDRLLGQTRILIWTMP
ncbi:16S rRNA (guanine(966)-N(2))-methyltransferase RsmD [Desulfovibrio legallii]|uniref:16S rRNA (Guanine966-N2)-methyltransferase n=1 Tax=Desulfovibrio legallii TaxID=571438 RepID=A0A1G7JYJ2_9BACT|nr:16S rRNA (guanine(966)-N(2))-methyltransferase RsmD [Desulfovibrio legallii]SDF29980.1 16S rRNA (guanine966-N2)-methyltransferase [Desulfovibrio legallii]